MAKKPTRQRDDISPPTEREAEGLRQLTQMVMLLQQTMQQQAPDQYEKMLQQANPMKRGQ